MAKLENLYTRGEEGERECAIAAIESILAAIKTFPKVQVYKTSKVINEICYPTDAIYFSKNKIYIPEKIVDQILGGDTYLSVESIVEILSNTRYSHRMIIPKEFYDQLYVMNPLFNEEVDCLVLNYLVLRMIAVDLIFE